MDSNQYAQKVVEKIDTLRKVAGLSVNALALAAAIPHNTLGRKLKGGGDFSIREVKSLAVALGTTAAEITLIYDPATSSAA